MKQEKIQLRKSIIKLHNKGKKQPEISYLLDIPQTTVSYWIRRFKETGDLVDKTKSGRPKWLNIDQSAELKKILLDFPPERFGGESMGWTTKMAIQYVKDKYGVQYSMRRMQELFHEFGLNLITPRSEHAKSSYAARTVYRMDFKKNSKTNIWVAPSLISMK
ncbi:MAG: winged helix-turn-helix domain-containing protein [Vicingaceae bacterium]|nr:winged helix-turn-helix domain-containing protein [Vicingaceae bacterium]